MNPLHEECVARYHAIVQATRVKNSNVSNLGQQGLLQILKLAQEGSVFSEDDLQLALLILEKYFHGKDKINLPIFIEDDLHTFLAACCLARKWHEDVGCTNRYLISLYVAAMTPLHTVNASSTLGQCYPPEFIAKLRYNLKYCPGYLNIAQSYVNIYYPSTPKQNSSLIAALRQEIDFVSKSNESILLQCLNARELTLLEKLDYTIPKIPDIATELTTAASAEQDSSNANHTDEKILNDLAQLAVSEKSQAQATALTQSLFIPSQTPADFQRRYFKNPTLNKITG